MELYELYVTEEESKRIKTYATYYKAVLLGRALADTKHPPCEEDNED